MVEEEPVVRQTRDQMSRIAALGSDGAPSGGAGGFDVRDQVVELCCDPTENPRSGLPTPRTPDAKIASTRAPKPISCSIYAARRR
ncbi:MAG: hypothetical protein AAGF30_06490, partial [Pseudomonadota bacterium]